MTQGISAGNLEFASLGHYEEAEVGVAMGYLMPAVLRMAGPLRAGMRVLDVGCGMGALAAEFWRRGCRVVGIDLDEANLELARRAYPRIRFVGAAANADLLNTLGEEPFDLVTCTEVVEHVYSPISLANGCHRATRPGGRLVISAPYHGYLKNLTIALLGHGDSHYDPLWEGGHIHFFSRSTMSALLTQAGFRDIEFAGAGRCPYLWKSLVMAATKPSSPSRSASSRLN
jgi:2-polyprenyl-6-hydroxyphenyl methylase/3-demethylubiquinone-9 3-methyltransferase